MDSIDISIFDYSDYRSFLRDWYQKAHEADKRFSHRYIASKLGMSSSSWFNDLLKGKNNIRGTHLVKLAALVKLKDRESDYLETLVQCNQASSIEEKNRYFRKLLTFKEANVDIVGREKFEFYGNWYNTAIRELLFILVFKGDYETLARKLNPSIKPAQAKEAIGLLERLGFIRKDAQGVYRPQSTILKKDSSFKSLYAANFLLATMELGMQALERFEKEERHISAMTLSLSKAGQEKALEEIEALKRRLISLVESEAEPEKVFQFNIQLFPLTR